MKIKTVSVKLLFHDNKLNGTARPDVKQQEAILACINEAMREWNANIIEVDVCASIDEVAK